MDKQGQVNEHGQTDELMCVFYPSSMGKAYELRAWISEWNYDMWPLETWLQEDRTGSSNLQGFDASDMIEREAKNNRCLEHTASGGSTYNSAIYRVFRKAHEYTGNRRIWSILWQFNLASSSTHTSG